MRSVPEQLRHGVRAVLRPVGEFVHVSAIYLGLAVLTTLGLSLVLPSMRQQSQQLHEVVLAMFQADGGGYAADDEAEAPDWSLPQAAPTPSDGVASAASPDDAAADGAAVDQADQDGVSGRLTFASALAASLRDQPIPGVTQAQAHALRSYLARKYRIASSVAGALIRTTFEVGRERKLDPQLLLAVIAIESRYNPFVESAVGAQGLMQVMTRVHRDKLRPSGGAAAVFDPVTNIRVGAQILSDCIRRRGGLEGGLACYVGATGPSDGGYGARVLAERRRIALASGIPPRN
ncbi:MAG: lytic transglycosylase domain-containing protein [Castellaniella sp.]|uniref:lytic transglycosylase domain-containing protein n=1 Tax=Castellaniella sp. TaxID=1955812 RepID=UPI002A36209C|nr:lytic transglycosylase domain-containing protein [Castellaniella sp.]MDY0308873.1 lytic transglycosylase domain-containing protein [Castellaniella sp.]